MKQKINSFPVMLFITVISTLLTMILIFALGIAIFNIFDLEVQQLVQNFGTSRIRLLIGGMLVSSFICAAMLSFALLKIQLKPYNLLKYGLSMLKKGEYSVRLDTKNLGANEFSDLINSFNLLAQELENTELFRKDFINNFSHEFKTPISSIKGFAKILQSDSLSEDEKKEYLAIIVSESSRLSGLAQNILTLSKVEHQGIITDEENYQLSEQIRLTILALENNWAKKNLNFNLALADFNFYGNRELLHHVWFNLIENAIKFSPINADIDLSLEQKEDKIIFKIRDYGIGMDEETISHIFNRFYQGDKSHATSGHGIGLSIVKSVVDFYKGQIVVGSQPHEGSSFVVELVNRANSV